MPTPFSHRPGRSQTAAAVVTAAVGPAVGPLHSADVNMRRGVERPTCQDDGDVGETVLPLVRWRVFEVGGSKMFKAHSMSIPPKAIT